MGSLRDELARGNCIEMVDGSLFRCSCFFVWQELNELDGFGFANYLDKYPKEEYSVLCNRPTVGLLQKGSRIMPRIVKEPLERRNEILDATQQLIISKGYERMTIQDVIDRLQISKGAFYHYFNSKQALLDALIERLQSEALGFMRPLLASTQMPALEKLNFLFDNVYQWKTARKGYLMQILHAWYTDDNVIVRQKQTAAMLQAVSPIIQQVIEQGIAEGVFNHPHPAMLGRVILSLIVDQGNAMAELLLNSEISEENALQIEQSAAAYTSAIERVLGVADGSLKIFDMEAIKREWADG